MNERKPPVEVGDEFDIYIEAVGEKGDGIAKKKGFILFIPGVKQGENVKIRVTKVLSKVGFAEKIGDATGPVQRERKERGPQVQPTTPTQYEDTEDFGEEPAEESTEKLVEESKGEETTENLDEDISGEAEQNPINTDQNLIDKESNENLCSKCGKPLKKDHSCSVIEDSLDNLDEDIPPPPED